MHRRRLSGRKFPRPVARDMGEGGDGPGLSQADPNPGCPHACRLSGSIDNLRAPASGPYASVPLLLLLVRAAPPRGDVLLAVLPRRPPQRKDLSAWPRFR